MSKFAQLSGHPIVLWNRRQGKKWEEVPEDFECPLCAVGKDQFSPEEP